MKESTYKTYLEPGLRIQLVNIWISFTKGESWQIRINRKRVLTTQNYIKALNRFNKEVSQHINQLSLDI